MATPPMAPRTPHVHVRHGREFPDDYAWMTDGGQALSDYLAAERAYYAEATAGLDPLRRRLFDEMVARTPLVEDGPAHVRGGVEYRDHVGEGAQLGRFEGRAAGGAWSTLLDLDAEAAAAGSTYAELGAREVSPDGRLLAWSLDTTGEELYTLRVRDIATGRDLPESIPGTYYGGGWSADSGTFLYTRTDVVFRPHQVWAHRVGTDPAQDVLVLQEDDRRFELYVRASRCGRWLLIESASRDTTETWAIPAEDPGAPPVSVGGRRARHEYQVEPLVGGPRTFLAVTNHGGAREFTLSWLDLGQVDPSTWLPAAQGPLPGDAEDHPVQRRFTGVDAFAGHVVLSLRESGQRVLYLVPVVPDGLDWAAAEVVLPPPGGTIELGTNEEFDPRCVTVVTQTKVEPPAWWDVPWDGAEWEPRHRAQAPNHDPGAYVVERRWVTARDGVSIPVTLVHHRVTPLDGSAPCLLHGYGAYEYVVEPTFSRALPSLLDRGVVYAHAHVRGGGELGRRWWDDGHLAAKANSFHDLVDVARALGTGPGARVDGARIVARGGSAGGLLVAASMNEDPEAFAGIVAEVPFVDVVTSMSDPDLPLTVAEWEEWGDPREPDQFGWMIAYSPYENLAAAGRRPFVLATGAVNDPRVLVHEPAKWVARMRATDPAHAAVMTPGRRGGVLLRVELGEGSHSGAAGRYAVLEQEADTQAVIMAVMGISG